MVEQCWYIMLDNAWVGCGITTRSFALAFARDLPGLICTYACVCVCVGGEWWADLIGDRHVYNFSFRQPEQQG